jgi:hypothetical protein
VPALVSFVAMSDKSQPFGIETSRADVVSFRTLTNDMQTSDDLTCEKAAAEAAREKRIASFMVAVR